MGFWGRLSNQSTTIIAVIFALSLLGLFAGIAFRHSDVNNAKKANIVGQYDSQQIPLSGLVLKGDQATFGSAQVVINGPLQLNGPFIITPSLQPSSPKAGQIYFDQNTNQLAYFNGSEFVILSKTQKAGAKAAVVDSVGGLIGQVGLGNGLAAVDNQLFNAGDFSLAEKQAISRSAMA